ncbi:MAG: ABC transporter permease, partial [Planctomycetota bacterium]
GGLGAYDRTDQLSHQFVDSEIEQNRSMGMFAPTIFLGVSAFLLNIVMSRTINSQREQIAALKAFGYSNVEVGWHYLKTVLLIVAGSLAVGIPLGVWFGRSVTEMYAALFHFPDFTYRIYPSVGLAAAAVSVVAAVVGVVGAVIRAVRLPPAEAMRSEPPTGYGPTLLERIGLGQLVPPIARMVLRQLERHRYKSLLSTLAIAMAASVMVVGNFVGESIDYMIDSQFHRVQRYDVAVATNQVVSDRAAYELASLRGVVLCEPTRGVAARLRAGPRSRRVSVLGIPPNSELFGLLDMEGREAKLPAEGMLVSQKLAQVLDIEVGDWVQFEALEGKRPVSLVRIEATLEDFTGLSAYMSLAGLHRLMREGPVLTGANLLIDPAHEGELYTALRSTPHLAGVAVKRHAIDSFEATVQENMNLMKSINMAFACIIAIGVVYNCARISLAERSRELATLRVIGFTRAEISSILLGELAVVTLAAIPIGLALGWLFAKWMCESLDQELFRFPLIVGRRTYALSAGVVLAAAIASGLVVRRRLDRLDLVAALKARE